MRCGRCGNQNSEANRFCGMCGAPLLAKSPDAGPAPGPVAAEASGAGSTPVERRPAAVTPPRDEPQTGPVITGHSFLGLNAPAPEGRGGGHGDRSGAQGDAGQDHLRPSANLDYLLEDEEPPKRGGGKLILVVVALALAVGFGYLHWKRGGFDWLNASDKKPAAATPEAATQSGADSGGTAATPNSATTAGSSGTGTAPATGGPTPVPPDSAAPSATPTQAGPAGAPAQAPGAQSGIPQNAASQNTAPQSKPSDAGAAAVSASPAAGPDSESKPPAAEPAAEAPERKAAAKPTATRPADPVTTAERYIYGRGVKQDCDHGLRLLKRATEQSNAKAMISMGAVYSTGTCTPRDLPTAYRWFALALHKEPDNQALQDDLQKLWSQMTPPERQLAIKLSQ